MKILFVIKSFAMKAGGERLMSDKMNYMADQGHEIILVTYEQGNHPMAFHLNSSIKHIDLNTRFFSLKRYSLPVRAIEVLKMKRLFRMRLQKVVDEVKPEIIHTTTYAIHLVDIILGLKTNAKKTIESQVCYESILKEVDFKGRFLLQDIARLYDHITLRRLKGFDAFFALTKGDAAQWKRYVDNIFCIPNPLTSYPKKIENHNVTHNRIICAGRLNPQKGFDLLIDSFALVADKCPEWNIDIFGSGDEESFLREKLREKKLEKRILIHPATDNIYMEFQRSDFFVFSSRFEGWGLVLVEAMACGIPPVSFRCKYGPEDIISDGDDGLLAKDGDIQDLSEKILWMINHPEQRQEMGKKARVSALRFNKDIVVQRWLEIFQSILS